MNDETANIEPWKRNTNNTFHSVEASGRSPAPCSQTRFPSDTALCTGLREKTVSLLAFVTSSQ